MRIDKTTLYDLSVFDKDEDFSLFHKIDFTKTIAGRLSLLNFFKQPFGSIEEILQVQDIIKIISNDIHSWPSNITNGTLLVIDKFLDDNPETIPAEPNPINTFIYKFIHPTGYSMILFSVKQLFELVKGYELILRFFKGKEIPQKLSTVLSQAEKIISHKSLQSLKGKKYFSEMDRTDILNYGRFFHVDFAAELRALSVLYGSLDAWYSMAMATKELKLNFPTFIESSEPIFNAKGLHHPLLQNPVPYNLELNDKKNFIFLTGANMAGKSTLIKSVGIATYLAHLGMGVPAQSMSLTLFEGILSNINVADNIVKGESYFFNEVKRIKETLATIGDGKRWLVLIDELFKGTNIQDAMKCSLTVVGGLVKMKTGLFILSSHLYEIGDELKQYPAIGFKYFETNMENNELKFSYQLKEGISTDRIGYLILKKEGVVDMIEGIGKTTISND
jgi:DNA mismatch repair protein MutS